MPRLSSTDKELGLELGQLGSLPGPSSSRVLGSLALASPAKGNHLGSTTVHAGGASTSTSSQVSLAQSRYPSLSCFGERVHACSFEQSMASPGHASSASWFILALHELPVIVSPHMPQ